MTNKNTYSSIPAIFIVGVGRSGTSLLQSMMGSHSKVAFPSEISFLRRFLFSGRLSNEEAEGVFRLLNADSKLRELDLDLSEIHKGCRQLSGEEYAIAFYREILRCVARKKSGVICGDKDPRNVEFLRLLALVCPAVRILHIFRDPRDVLASKKEAEWSKNRPIWQHLLAGCSQIELCKNAADGFLKGRVMHIQYEHLISQPEEVLMDVCDFVEIQYEPSMLAFQGEGRRLAHSHDVSWKRETWGPLKCDNFDNWRTALRIEEIYTVEEVCRETIEWGGYRRGDYSLGDLTRCRLKAAALMIRIGARCYCWFRALNNAIVAQRLIRIKSISNRFRGAFISPE